MYAQASVTRPVSWDRKRRVVAKVEWHGAGEAGSPCPGFIVTIPVDAPPSGWWPSTINEAKRSSTSS